MLLSMSFAITAMSVLANDSILVHKTEYAMGRANYERSILANPALTNLQSIPSLSEISITGMSEPAAMAKIPQLGTGGRFFKVNASSFQHLGKNNAVWGNASYQSGRKYDVVWNETSDFLLIYPYAMADGRGGDLKYEEYKLNGGYSTRKGKFYYGAELGYRALSEYRDHDPRPNNTVADLQARIGFGYGVLKDYVLAVAADAGKYKQTNELAFYNELGAQMEYHLTGIGNDFARFSGQSNNTFFKGYNFGTELNLANTNGTGWSASAGYMFTQKEKVLTDLNRLPLNKLKINQFKGSIGFNGFSYGIRLSGSYADRKGNDNLFGDATGNIYPQIGTKEQYSGSVAEVKADVFWTIKASPTLLFNIEPEFAYLSFTNRHHASGNNFNSNDLQFKVHSSMTYRKGANMISADIDVARRQNLSTEMNLYNSVNESLTTTLQNIKSYFHDGETYFGMGAEYTRKVWDNKAITVGFLWQHTIYLGTSNNCYEAKLAFCL